MSPAPQSSSAAPLSGWPLARYALGAALLGLLAVQPVDSTLDATLDTSNYGSYAWFAATGRHFGSEVVSMAGPYGFIHYGFVYSGLLVWPRFVLELLVKLGLGALILWFFRRSPGRVVPVVWLVAVVAVLPLIGDTAYTLAILLAGLALLLRFESPGRDRWSYALAALLALLSLGKGTQVVLASTTLGLVAVQAVLTRQLARGLALVGAFVAAYLALWLAAGQRLGDLPGFLRGIAELSSGYNSAMGLEEPAALTQLGVTLAVLLVGTGLTAAWRHRRTPARACAAFFLAGFSFLQWKHGFVRADDHVLIFFHFATAAALLPVLLGPARWPALLPAALTLALAANGAVSGQWARWLAEPAAAVRRQLPGTLAPAATFRSFAALLDAQRARFALPVLQRHIGAGTVDFFGSEHGVIPLNGLDYHPRPFGGGAFNVFTEHLKSLNEAFLLDPARRPDFYLLKTDILDDRLLTQDDSRALIPLLWLYHPITTERGIYLLAQTPSAPVPPAPVPVATIAFRWEEPVTVPPLAARERPDLLFASVDLQLNWLGRLRAFFYKPPQVHLELITETPLAHTRVRLIPEMARSPILLSPVIEDAHDLVDLYGAAPGKVLRQFRVTSAGARFYAPASLRIHFFRAPRPPADPGSARVAAFARFPAANLPAASVTPAAFPHFLEGTFVVGVHAPTRAVFPLTGDERTLDLSFGLEPGAYLGGGHTDGVDFIVELQPSAAIAPQRIHHRFLDPVNAPADRGLQSESVVLPPFRPGARLIFRTDPGPHGDGAWDWAYVTRFAVARGPLQLAQFPGFNVAPRIVDADTGGALDTGDGQVFMLNAPGALLFDLDGSARTLAFTAGFMPGAYTSGETDGADCIVELRAPDGSVTPLFRRLLAPLTVPADRGPQPVTVALPPHAAGSTLIVRTDVGPAGSNAWDWTYVANLHIN